jgi:hypothetical protein
VSLLIDQLAAYLEDQGEGTVGTDLFKISRPPSPVACVSLHATGGYPPDRYVSREHPTLMLFARAATPDGALRKAYSLHRALHGKQNVDLGGDLWALTIEAGDSPAYLGSEQAADQTAHLASFNIIVDLRTPSS